MFFDRIRRRLRREARDLIEVVLLPGLAVVLPWPLCFAVFKRLAYWNWLYREACAPALAQALERGHCTNASAWAYERRLVTLLDHADHYLFRTRSDAWMARYVDVQGHWGAGDQAGMLWTFHWGAGLWALRHARVSGMRAKMVLAAPRGPDFAGRTVFRRYVRARMRSVHLALEQPVIFAPGAMAQVRSTLAQQEQVVVVMDVPQDQVQITRLTDILGQPVSVPAVLPQMAVDEAIAVTVFYMGVDVNTGRRPLCVLPLGIPRSAEYVTNSAFSCLDSLLKTAPAAWHLWSEAPRFFTARAADMAASVGPRGIGVVDSHRGVYDCNES